MPTLSQAVQVLGLESILLSRGRMYIVRVPFAFPEERFLILPSRHDEPLPLPRSTSTTRQNVKQIEAPKPMSPKENFFPISWRVIGGGVVVGTNKDSTPVPEFDSPPSVPGSPTTPDNLAHPQLEIKTSNLHSPTQRKRSNSIPNTPSSSQLLVGNVSVPVTILIQSLLTTSN
jgi:hypothetical protein